MKKVVKAEAAQKIPTRSPLKVSKTSTGAPELGKRRLGERSGVGVGGGGVAPIPESEAMDVSVEEGDGLPPEGTADELAMRSPSGEALAALRRRIAQLQDRAVALQGEIRAADYRGRQDRLQTLMPGGHHQRRRAADIMQLISAGVGGGGGGGEDGGAAARAVEWERAVLDRPILEGFLDEVYRSGNGASNRPVKCEPSRSQAVAQVALGRRKRLEQAIDPDTNNDDDSDDDEEEENAAGCREDPGHHAVEGGAGPVPAAEDGDAVHAGAAGCHRAGGGGEAGGGRGRVRRRRRRGGRGGGRVNAAAAERHKRTNGRGVACEDVVIDE